MVTDISHLPDTVRGGVRGASGKLANAPPEPPTAEPLKRTRTQDRRTSKGGRSYVRHPAKSLAKNKRPSRVASNFFDKFAKKQALDGLNK